MTRRQCLILKQHCPVKASLPCSTRHKVQLLFRNRIFQMFCLDNSEKQQASFLFVSSCKCNNVVICLFVISNYSILQSAHDIIYHCMSVREVREKQKQYWVRGLLGISNKTHVTIFDAQKISYRKQEHCACARNNISHLKEWSFTYYKVGHSRNYLRKKQESKAT